MSNVHANMYGDISIIPLFNSAPILLNIRLVFSLKIGTNDCRIFILKHGFMSFRIGFHTAPAAVD